MQKRHNTEDKDYEVAIIPYIKLTIGYNRKSKLRFLIVSLSLLLVSFLGIYFGLNHFKKTYQTNWYYDITSFQEEKYLDGSTFNTDDLISLKTLTEVKNSDSSFKSINVEKMILKDDISIQKEENSTYLYSITVKSKYFKSRNQAKAFCKAITEVPLKKTSGLIEGISNDDYLSVYDEYADTYEELVGALINQSQLITNVLGTLEASYADRYISVDGSNVVFNNYYINSLARIQKIELDDLRKQIDNSNCVYHYAENVKKLNDELNVLNKSLDLLDDKISVLKQEIDRQVALVGSNSVTVEGLNSRLADLLLENEDKKTQKVKIENRITYGETFDTKDIDDKLANAYDTLSGIASDVTTIQKDLYLSKGDVYFRRNGIITDNGYGLVKSALISVVLAIVVAGVVNIVVDYKKYKDYLEKKEEISE